MLLPDILVDIDQLVASPTLEFDQHPLLELLLINYHSLIPENPIKKRHNQ